LGFDVVPPFKKDVCEALNEKPDGSARLKFMQELASMWKPEDSNKPPKMGALGVPVAPGSGYMQLKPLDHDGNKFSLFRHNQLTGKDEEVATETYGPADKLTGARKVIGSSCDDIPMS
jgi:hypothetical protein